MIYAVYERSDVFYMKRPLYIYRSGELKRKDNTIKFIAADDENDENSERQKDRPIEQCSEIYAFGNITLNSSIVNLLSQYGICIHFFNYYSFYTGSFYPREHMLAGQLLVKQVEHYCDDEKRLAIAQKFIDAASFNIYRNLRYYNGRGKDLKQYMNDIEDFRKKIYKSQSVSELMGYEGNIRKIYYSAWNVIVNQKIDFEKRVKHPPDNMINTLISYVNSVIYTKVLSELYITQLNPTISYLHEPGTRRFSLALDLSEIFKPIIGDRIIFSLLNKKMITEKSFTKNLNYLHLTEEGSRAVTKEIDNRLKETINHKELGKNVSYQYLMRLEAYKLIKHLIDEKEYDGFKMWW